MPYTGPYEMKRNGSVTKFESATVYKQDEWLKEGSALFGSYGDMAFECPACHHIQSVNSCIEHGDTRDKNEIINSLYQECEGRYNPHHGCDYAIYGLFTLGSTIVERPDGGSQRVFPFAASGLKTTEGPRQGLMDASKYKARLKAWEQARKEQA